MKPPAFSAPLEKQIFNPVLTVIVFCILLLLSIWLTHFSVTENDRIQTESETYRVNNLLTRAFEEHVSRSLNEVEQKLKVIKTEYERNGIETQAIRAVYKNVLTNQLTLQSYITDADGNMVSLAQGGVFANLADRDFFRYLRDNDDGKIFISKPVLSRTLGLQVVPIACRVNRPDGSFAGIAGISVDPEYFSRFYKDMGLEPPNAVRVVGLDMVVRAGNDPNISGPGQDMTGALLFEETLKGPSGQYLSTGRLFGEARYFSFRILPHYPLLVQVGVSAKAAMAGFHERKTLYMRVAAGASVLVLLYTLFIILTLDRQRRSDELWQLAVASANDGVWDWDIVRDKTHYSRRCEEMLGFAAGGMAKIAGGFSELVHPDDRAANDGIFAAHFAGQTDFFSAEQRLRTAEGSYKWFQIRGRCARNKTGECVRMVGTITDIDDDRKYRQALHDSQARYKALVKQSFEGIVVSDAANGRILSANPAAVGMFGYSEEEFKTLTVKDLDPSEETEFQKLMDNMFRDGGIATATVERLRKDGSLIRVERTTSLVSHMNQMLIYTTYRDLTEERKLEEKIRADVKLAGEVQRAMLPGDYEDCRAVIRTIYEPIHLVSGDYYGYRWSRDGYLLNGFLLDVTGHGMATALQTSAVSTVLNEEMAQDRPWTAEALEALNEKLTPYLPGGSFAAALFFSVDFNNRTLTCVSAGINHFLLANKHNNGWISLAGSLLGVPPLANFGVATYPLQHGDTVCFPTDGISERLIPSELVDLKDFDNTVKQLLERANRIGRSDDCSAICIKIKGFSPHYFRVEICGKGHYDRLQQNLYEALK